MVPSSSYHYTYSNLSVKSMQYPLHDFFFHATLTPHSYMCVYLCMCVLYPLCVCVDVCSTLSTLSKLSFLHTRCLSFRHTHKHANTLSFSVTQTQTHTHMCACICSMLHICSMRWLRLVGSLKLYVSFAKESYRRDYILQYKPLMLRSPLVVVTPYPHHLYETHVISSP